MSKTLNNSKLNTGYSLNKEIKYASIIGKYLFLTKRTLKTMEYDINKIIREKHKDADNNPLRLQ